MALQDIDHIVVLMLENRSFDSILGRLYPKGPGFEGLDGTESNPDAAGNDVDVWTGGGTDTADMSIPTPDPGELFTDINMQVFGAPDAPVPPVATMSGFARNYQAQTASPPYDPRSVMHYFTPEQVPVISALARQFAVCDCWHASAPCQTWPNRFFVHTGTAGGYQNNSPPHFPYQMPTIFQRLENAGVPWKVYFHDVPQALTLSELWLHMDHFRPFDEFLDDAKSGELPAYSFLEPRYFTDLALPNDQHPPHNVTLGEQLIAQVYNALRQGPRWSKTLLLIIYDEHGGNFDHVPPPPATPPDDRPTEPFNFDRYGVRVPAVIVSPYIKAGTVLRPTGDVPFDHTSVIATLRARFDLGPPLTNRDAVAPDLAGVLQLALPENDGPESLEPLPYEPSPDDVAAARAAPLNGHQQGLTELAGHLPSGGDVIDRIKDGLTQFLRRL
jgi:phospholipase C